MKVPASDSDANVGAIHELPLQKTLPEGWGLATLGEICLKPQYGWTTKANHEKGRLKLLRTTDITSGVVNWDTVPYCTEEPEDIKKYLVESGDILISRAGSVGVSFLINKPERSIFASYLIRFRPNEPIDRKYVYYYLKSPDYWAAIGASKVGIAVPNVNASKLSQVPIPIAPANEQKLIVAEIEKQFSRLDEAVAALKRIMANLKRYKASVLKAAVEGKLTEEWRRGSSRTAPIESGKDLLKRILVERRKKWEKEHPGKKYKEPAAVGAIHELPLQNELPKGWVWATLSQIGELNRGKSKHRPRSAPHLYGGHYPFVQTGDIKNAKGILCQYTQTYSEAGLKQSKLWPVGTLCITIAANIADTAILGFNSCFPDSIVGFVAEPSHCDIRFVEYFIRTAKENIERFAPATAQKNINLEILSDIAVPLPPFIEQQFIVEEVERRLSVTEEIEAEIETNLKRAERLRQSILKKAFSGRLA